MNATFLCALARTKAGRSALPVFAAQVLLNITKSYSNMGVKSINQYKTYK
jgi:hypothetical protein